MIDLLLPVVLFVGIVTLAVAIVTFRSARRSETLNEGRYEFLREQHDRLMLLREERQMLIEQMDRESRERKELMEIVGQGRPELLEELKQARKGCLESSRKVEQLDKERLRLEREIHRIEQQLERERREHLETRRRAERLEQEHEEEAGIRREAERLGQEHQRLMEDLQKTQEARLEAVRRVERLEQGRLRSEGEIQRLRKELERQGQIPGNDRVDKSQVPRLLWRRPIVIIALLLAVITLWMASLMVALSLV
jgi:hypothetical protein